MAEDAGTSGAGSAAQIEAEIRKRSRPMLSEHERKRAGLEQAIMGAQLAAARAHEAAAALTEKAAHYDAQVGELQQQLQTLPPPETPSETPPQAPPNGGQAPTSTGVH